MCEKPTRWWWSLSHKLRHSNRATDRWIPSKNLAVSNSACPLLLRYQLQPNAAKQSCLFSLWKQLHSLCYLLAWDQLEQGVIWWLIQTPLFSVWQSLPHSQVFTGSDFLAALCLTHKCSQVQISWLPCRPMTVCSSPPGSSYWNTTTTSRAGHQDVATEIPPPQAGQDTRM